MDLPSWSVWSSFAPSDTVDREGDTGELDLLGDEATPLWSLSSIRSCPSPELEPWASSGEAIDNVEGLAGVVGLPPPGLLEMRRKSTSSVAEMARKHRMRHASFPPGVRVSVICGGSGE